MSGPGQPHDDPSTPGPGSLASTRDPDAASFVAALRSATTPSADDRAHALRILGLERFVAGVARHRRSHVAALLEAPLVAEARERTRVGLRPREERLFRGWVDLPMIDGGPVVDDEAGHVGRAALGAPDDTHRAVQRSTRLVRGLLHVAAGSDEAERMLDEMEAIAFATCHGTSASVGDGNGRRRILLTAWLALRRGRPLAAAVVRRCLALDRLWRLRGVAPTI